MSGVSNAFSNLFQSIIDILSSILKTAGAAFDSIFSIGSSVIGETAVLSKDVINLIFGNIIIIGIGLAGLVAYSAYQQRRGQDTVSRKKLQ